MPLTPNPRCSLYPFLTSVSPPVGQHATACTFQQRNPHQTLIALCLSGGDLIAPSSAIPSPIWPLHTQAYAYFLSPSHTHTPCPQEAKLLLPAEHRLAHAYAHIHTHCAHTEAGPGHITPFILVIFPKGIPAWGPVGD